MVPQGMQSPTHGGFVAVDQPYDCTQCVAWHAEQYRFPPLLVENMPAWDLFFRFQDQQRGGGFDVLGLDYAILPWAFRLYRIPDDAQRLTFEKIALMNREVVGHRTQARVQAQQAKQAAQQDAQGIVRLDR